MAEERLGGRLDPVGAAPVVNGVEVGAEDLLLAHLPIDLDGHDGLLELAAVGGSRIHVVVLDVLLRESRGPLEPAAAHIVDEGASDAPGIDAVVGVEAPVLAGDDGVADVVGQGARVDDGAVDLRELAHLGRAVGVVDGGRLGLRELAGLGDLDHRVGDDEGPHDGDDEEEEGPQVEAPAGDPAHDRPLARARVVDQTTALGRIPPTARTLLRGLRSLRRRPAPPAGGARTARGPGGDGQRVAPR